MDYNERRLYRVSETMVLGIDGCGNHCSDTSFIHVVCKHPEAEKTAALKGCFALVGIGGKKSP